MSVLVDLLWAHGKQIQLDSESGQEPADEVSVLCSKARNEQGGQYNCSGIFQV